MQTDLVLVSVALKHFSVDNVVSQTHSGPNNKWITCIQAIKINLNIRKHGLIYHQQQSTTSRYDLLRSAA